MCFKEIVLSLAVYFLFFNDLTTQNDQNLKYKPPREGKFFWGIGLVRFENSVCGGNNTLEGTCYTRRQCASVDGVASTKCAGGVGVCCVIQRGCGESSSLNNTYFVSPGFPNSYTGGSTCTITIVPCNSDICQVRIDFLSLTLAQPNDNGTCVTDALVVTGGASNVPIICGENSGQHIYVDFNGLNPITIQILTNQNSAISRNWNIKVTQIGCDCPTKAPTGCLQYYTALSGTVRSFNYGASVSQNGTRQLANENYGVCVMMQPGYCSITWSQSGGDQYSFSVSNNTNANLGDGTIGTPAAEIYGTNCTTDFVVIPSPVYANGSAATTDRFCGNGFEPVTSFSKPFVLTVVTDGNEVNDTANRGFSLMYQQNLCNSNLLMG